MKVGERLRAYHLWVGTQPLLTKMEHLPSLYVTSCCVFPLFTLFSISQNLYSISIFIFYILSVTKDKVEIIKDQHRVSFSSIWKDIELREILPLPFENLKPLLKFLLHSMGYKCSTISLLFSINFYSMGYIRDLGSCVIYHW